MLDEKDLLEISHLMSILIENEVTPRFHLLAEGQRTILETLAPKSKVEELEDEVNNAPKTLPSQFLAGRRLRAVPDVL